MTDPTLAWCTDHDDYVDRCLWRHDRPDPGLPDPWPAAVGDERDCPECDGAGCWVEDTPDGWSTTVDCGECNGTGTVPA